MPKRNICLLRDLNPVLSRDRLELVSNGYRKQYLSTFNTLEADKCVGVSNKSVRFLMKFSGLSLLKDDEW